MRGSRCADQPTLPRNVTLVASKVLALTLALGIAAGANTPGFSASACNLVASPSALEGSCVEGEVVASAYRCRLFVVRTKDRFIVVMHNRSDFTVIRGDRVVGSLHSPGVREIVVLEQMTIDVEVDIVIADSPVDQQVFAQCNPGPVSPLAGW